MNQVQWIGIAAGALTSVSMLPQLLKIIREKKATDVSALMLVVLLSGNALWVVYGCLKEDGPIITTNGISVMVNLFTLIFRIKYNNR